RSVLTHGFVVDGSGKAMHKSSGNVISPEDLIRNYGAEILRLWVAGEDYRDNIRLSDEILKRLTEAYRRIRNTCRYILGNLSDFEPATDSLPYPEMKELDRWALNRLQELNERVQRSYDNFDFHLVYHDLHNFCVLDLSSFYLDIIKDRLYTSPRESLERRSAQTAMNEILEVLVRLMAPILCFTADEVWQHMKGNKRPLSVHADLFIPVNDEYRAPELARRWEEILMVRKEVTKALELARKEKKIGHSLDSSVTLGLSPGLMEKLGPFAGQLRSIFIVSSVDMVEIDRIGECFESDTIPGLKVKAVPSPDPKCERCWVHDPTVGLDKNDPTVCKRCLKVINKTII
ncbi:MAG: class I tRNA ligase family protein, partial [Thermodesulfobacteriota bacterium]|nr:class I tRNA ligase family protein [Thermodesulfobacteriota bacterium]